MATFMECVMDLNNQSQVLNTTIEQVRIYTEAALREHQIQYKEAELKVLKESGTDEDLMILKEAADNGAIERIIKAIKKILDSLAEFVKTVRDKVKYKFRSKQSLETLNTMEQTLAKTPKLRSKKISYANTDEEEKLVQKTLAAVQKKVARIKSGHYKEKDLEELNELEEKTDSKLKTLKIAATAAIAIGSAIVLYRKTIGDIEDQKIQVNIKEQDLTDMDLSMEAGAALTKATGFEAKLNREIFNLRLFKCTSLWSGIKNALRPGIISKNLEEKDSKVYKKQLKNPHLESASDSFEFDNFDEEFDAFLESITTDEVMDRSSDNFSETYMEMMESTLFGTDSEDDEYLEESTSEKFDNSDLLSDMLELF